MDNGRNLKVAGDEYARLREKVMGEYPVITLFARNSLESHKEGNLNQLQQLLDGEALTVSLREFTTYSDLRRSMDFEVFLTLLHTGSLTFSANSKFTGEVTLRIPNEEVRQCFGTKLDSLYEADHNHQWFQNSLQLLDLLINNQPEEAQSLISSMLKHYLSIRNSGSDSTTMVFCWAYWVLQPQAGAVTLRVRSRAERGEPTLSRDAEREQSYLS